MTTPLEVPMTLASVNIDHGYPYTAWYLTAQRWNGFLLPYFDKATAMEVMAHSYGDGNWHYSKMQDAFVGMFEDSDEPDEWGSVDINVGGMIYHTYPIGAGAWVWQKTYCQNCDEDIVGAPDIKITPTVYGANVYHAPNCPR